MATIIDSSLFIANINLVDSFDRIQEFIDKFEPEVLKKLLGYEEYKNFIAGKDIDGSQYKKLLDGEEFTVVYNGQDVLLKWGGLKDLIVYYVYCYFQKYSVTSSNTVGETKSKQANSYNATINAKVLSAWNNFELLYGSSYGDVLDESAYNYLYANKDQFPKWIFTELNGSINGFDL